MTVLQFPVRRLVGRLPAAQPARRRRLDLPALACDQSDPLTDHPCRRPVPQPDGRPREHQRHWWSGDVDGVHVTISWGTP